MMDFSESGLISLLTNFVIIFLGVMTGLDGWIFFKKRERFVSLLVFGTLFMITVTAGILTSLIAVDFLSLILSLSFLVTLILGLRFKKTVSIFWGILILLAVGLFLSLLSYLVTGEEGTILARVTVKQTGEKQYRMTVSREGESREYLVQGEMMGFEAYQMLLKPYMGFLFGSKRILLTSVFSEKFNEDYTRGETFYQPFKEGFFDKKALWLSLEKKRLLLPGVQGVQRVMVSVMPEPGKTYELKMSHQGLILIRP